LSQLFGGPVPTSTALFERGVMPQTGSGEKLPLPRDFHIWILDYLGPLGNPG